MGAKGIKGFDAYYTELFSDRWIRLRETLTLPAHQVLRLNVFAPRSHLEQRFPLAERQAWAGTSWVPTRGREPERASNGLMDSYKLDLASLFPALALDVQSGERVLDMCAAPGGKSLVLAEGLRDAGELIANEISDSRRTRLSRVLREHLSPDVLKRVRVTAHDAGRWCLHEKDAFDRVLLDAPCSGERHLLESPAEMKTWSEARSKNLSIRQYTLLASAIQVVKPGGRIVYSTCSLSPRENDAVIARLLKRRDGQARVLSGRGAPQIPGLYPPPIGEATDYGWLVLPDQQGHGPIYFSILERVEMPWPLRPT